MQGLQSIGEIMSELGFKKDAADDVKRAFIMNLIRAAAVQDRSFERKKSAIEQAMQQTATAPSEPEQLSFTFEDELPLARAGAVRKIG